MPRRRTLIVLLASTLLSIVLFTVFLHNDRFHDVIVAGWKIRADQRHRTSENINLSSSFKRQNKPLPTGTTIEPKRKDGSLFILLWTSFFGKQDYLPTTKDMKCQERRCTLTSNRSLVLESAAVVFHFLDANTDDLPRVRTPNQRWIIFTIESPHHSDLSSFNNLVNWTATYRLDSDLYTPYGHVRKLTPDEKASRRPETPKDYANSKTKMIAWFVSNCYTPSGREHYVQELQKVIPVDIYGQCGNFSCQPKMSKECYANISRNYRFYLSFENSLCKDYITEKFYHILETEMIPVVFSEANYSQIAPPNSYIDALSFQSPEELGKFLLELSRDTARYNSYFTWKQHYAMGGYHWVCSMCQKLHDPTQKSSVYHDLRKWWNEDSHCWSWTDKKKKQTNSGNRFLNKGKL